MKPTIRLTGEKEFDRKLAAMSDAKAANRIAGSVLGAEATVAKKAMQSRAPDWMKDQIGVRKGKNRAKVYETKVGVGVGKRKKNSRKEFKGRAAAFVVGTAQRVRKELGGKFAGAKNVTQQQLSTGKIGPHPIVRQGFAAAQGQMKSKGKEAFDRAVERERKKAQLNK